MTAARIDIIDRARLRIGSEPLQSEGAAGADAAIRLYDDVVSLLTGLRPWSFARRTFALARLDPLPAPAFWRHRYQLPPERRGPPLAVFASRAGEGGAEPFLDWELEGDTVVTDAEEVWARCLVRPEPAVWPPLFREVVIVALASEMAIVVRQDLDLRAELRRLAYGDDRVPGDLGLLQKAATADAQAQPSTVLQIDGGPLVAVRRS